jgi:hypothetical protein
MRTLLFGILFLVAACSNGTQLDVQSTAVLGATLTSNGLTTALDNTGHAHLLIEPELKGGDIFVTVERDGKSVQLFAECVEPALPGGEISQQVQEVALSIRRQLSDGSCVALITSMVTQGQTFPGNADGSKFDDAPCGPFSLVR